MMGATLMSNRIGVIHGSEIASFGSGYIDYKKAKTAYDTALQQFSGNDAVLAKLIANTQSLVATE